MLCPLCKFKNESIFSYVNQKRYFKCTRCELIYLDSAFYLSADQEKQRYQTHENNPKDPRYQKFLKPVLDSVLTKLKKQSLGLDFGCGEGSPLAEMFAQHGHSVKLYDAFFFPDKHVFKQRYDFIIASETVEHLHHPKKELEQLLNCLQPGAYLCIMTQFYNSKVDFETWYYHRDPTHVAFFCKESFEYLAKIFSAKINFPQDNIALFTKGHA